jgi:hypothetical protein
VRCENLILTTVLPYLVSCVLYHLAQLNFLQFMSIFESGVPTARNKPCILK